MAYYGGNAVKAFVNFRGTSSVSIRNSYNVSSVSDNGTGKYTVNFSSSVGSDPTAQVTTSWSDGSRAGWGGLTPSSLPGTTAVQIYSQQPSNYSFMDAVVACVTVYRN
tara:strand:+ start:347 stop:670 length:324 start_codon:yes stop_codon:yes gene_type:complete